MMSNPVDGRSMKRKSPLAWKQPCRGFGLPSTVAHHIKALVKSILFGLARLGARTTPRSTAIGQELAERHLVVTKFIASIADLPHVTITELSINQLLPKAERVVVINSTVGFEALIHGRPTLTFGASEYGPLTTLIRHVDDISEALTSPPWFDELKTAQFLQYFFEQYCVHADDEDGIFRKLQETLAVLPPRFGWTVVP